MNSKQFYTKLGIVTLLSILLIFCLNFNPLIQSAQMLSWTTISFFVLLSLLIFIVGTYVAKQKNKNTFTSVILLVMITKMFLCILIVAIYAKVQQPTNNYFLIPFFSIYLIYTIFEVHLMTRLGKNG